MNTALKKWKSIIEKSFSDLKYTIRSAIMLFSKESKVYINMHLVSTKDFDKDRLIEFSEALPENMKLLIEHIPSDNFESFLKVFGPLCSKKFGLTFDTAHIFGAGTKIEDVIAQKKYEPSLIHLNGNLRKFGSGSDEHIGMCSDLD